MSRARKKNGIPDRWLDYQAVGKRLPGTRFIAFKVPLKSALNHKLPSSDVFGPWELLDSVKKEKQELGLIIDLTFTTRYYRAEDVPESLLCFKIFTAGHEVPSDATILSFKRAVHRFLQENADNDKLIGVHCTHGLNRTGYLICRYLIDVDGMDPQEAVELFNSARGHAMERQNYLEDLQSGPKRSNEGIEECEQEPVRGCATHRPVYPEVTEEEGALNHEPSHDSFPVRGMNHHSRPHPRGLSSGGPGLLPLPPGLLPLPFPRFGPPTGAPFHPYRWTPPQPDAQWGGGGAPYPRSEIRLPPPPLCDWRSAAPYSPYSQGGGRRGRNSHQRPQHTANDTYTDDVPVSWDGPKMKTRRHNQRVNPYDYPA